MKRILLVAVALAVTSGVAAADHRHGGYWRGGGWGGGGGWRGGVVVTTPRYVAPRVYVQPRVYVHPRPIYVARPQIRYHYYNYYQRPAVYVENYPPRTGYYWVAGQWTWSGAEWIWQPGHYEPDPAYYSQPGYDQSYDPNYQYNDGY
jgi:hypothetical protein